MRNLEQVLEHLRFVIANKAIDTTLVQEGDLQLVLDEIESLRAGARKIAVYADLNHDRPDSYSVGIPLYELRAAALRSAP